jgi:hypothetical protein
MSRRKGAAEAAPHFNPMRASFDIFTRGWQKITSAI